MNVQFFVLEKLKILYGSRHSHQKHGVKKYRCAVPLFSGLPFIISLWRILFQRYSKVTIFWSDKVEVNEKGIYYVDVNKKYFMEKMAEWHVELEDNKPEEIPPWKEHL